MNPRRSALACLVVVALVAALDCRPSATPPDPRPELTRALQTLVDRAVDDNDAVHGVALHVDAPGLDLAWEGAAGAADPASGTPMAPDHPVRIASNTKTYVAAAVLRLSEEGRLGLDDPIARHLPDDYLETLRGDGYDPEAITVRHLLTHTGGLYDHADSPNYTEAILADPNHRWTPDEQLEAAMAWGDPRGAPGEFFHYADTGYILLGEIIEQIDGRPIQAAVRELLGFERLGLSSTWWETLEPRPDGAPDRAHQFFGDTDTAEFDPSFDLYGGGGLAATVGDMARFFRAIFKNGVYTEPGTAATMLTTVDGVRAGEDDTQMAPGVYRMGVWVVEIDGYTTYRHSGFWGTLATYVPELDLTVACTVNQNQGKAVLEHVAVRAIALVAEATEPGG